MLEVSHEEIPFSPEVALLGTRAGVGRLKLQEGTGPAESKQQAAQKGDLEMHATATCAMTKTGTHTPYPELREDHDLSEEEQKIRQALMARFSTIEEAAEALRLNPALFVVGLSTE